MRKHPVEGNNPNCRCGESGSTTWAAVKPGQVLECGVKMARKIAGCVQGLVPRLLWWQADFCVVRVPGGVFCPSRKLTGSNYGTEASVLSCADDPSSGTPVTSAAGALSVWNTGTPAVPVVASKEDEEEEEEEEEDEKGEEGKAEEATTKPCRRS